MIDKPAPGVQTDARGHPAGLKGAMISLGEVASRAWKGRMSPRLRAWVTQQLDKCGRPRGRREQAQCILTAFRKAVPYVADPLMGEFMATPDQLLCLDEDGLCIVGGDCFPEGTMLLRDDYTFVPIEHVEVGQSIWGLGKWSKVTEKWPKGELAVDAIELSTGSTVYLTRDHKVYVERRDRPSQHWSERIAVSDLTEGEALLQPDRIELGKNSAHRLLAWAPQFKRLEIIDLDEAAVARTLRELDDAAESVATYSTTSRTLMLQLRVLYRMLGEATSVRVLAPDMHGGVGEHPLWRVRRRTGGPFATVRSIERAVRKVPCWDISTDDHYVYLPEHDVTVSNCDEAAITLAAAMMTLGYPAMIVGTSHKPPYDVPTHVLMAFEDDLKDWVKMDGTTNYPVGQVAPHVREWWVEPGKEQKERNEGDFVGMSTLGSGDGALARAEYLDLLFPVVRK